MKYLSSFLDSYQDDPAKPAKPPFAPSILTESYVSDPAKPAKPTNETQGIDPGDPAPCPAPRPMQPHAWREVIAHWTIPMRQQWGELANAKQDAGMAWHDAEREAFWAVGDRYSYDPITASCGKRADYLQPSNTNRGA